MRRILFVAFVFVVLLHFVQVAATRRTRRVERPCALEQAQASMRGVLIHISFLIRFSASP
jgi:hypothetical protein